MIIPLPTGPWGTIFADPPWKPALHADNPRRATKDKGGPQKHYAVLEVEEIELLCPDSAPQAHLYLWVINQHIDWGYRVARAWGFEPENMWTWCKPGLGVGRFRCNTEHILLCRKGKRAGNPWGRGGRHAQASAGTWFQWPRGRHSEKPVEPYAMARPLSPGPYLEMFARVPKPGWTPWGNEVSDVVQFSMHQEFGDEPC